MERLTERCYKAEDGYYLKCSATLECCENCDECDKLNDVVNRLAAYEDTGMEPDMIEATINGQITLQKALEKYTQAEEQGRLVVLPCKVGDTVYAVKFATHEETEDGDLMPIAGGGEWVIWTVRASIINYCDYRTKKTHGYVVGSTQNGSGVTFDFDDFGKTVFLTREEAERALERQK